MVAAIHVHGSKALRVRLITIRRSPVQSRCLQVEVAQRSSSGQTHVIKAAPFYADRNAYNREFRIRAMKSASAASPLQLLNQRIIACERCPRLRAYCADIALKKRRAYMQETYWGRPVPAFGDENARVLILGLAPGAHGSNRTGRPFTGDGSGYFLYPVLYEAGFASQPNAHSVDDGLRLHDVLITSVGRCAPPDNKPTPEELRNCSVFLDEEIALLHQLKVVVCLGGIAWKGYLQHLRRTGAGRVLSGMAFAHGAEYRTPHGKWILGSYHPSLQNTNTGRLTADMLLHIFQRARQLADAVA
jgi:uracil-DNA glycosylase